MKLFNLEVFNGGVSGTGATNYVYSSIGLAATLGSAEKYAVQVIATGVTGSSPALTVKLQSSNDGDNWTDKSVLLNQMTCSPNVMNTWMVNDTGTTPGGAFVRVAVGMAGSDNNATVKVIVTGHAEQSSL